VGHLLGAPSPSPRHRVVTMPSPTSLCWTSIDSVTPSSSLPARIAAFAFDTPRSGERTPGAGLEVNGWVIGGASPPVGVRATGGHGPGITHPLSVRRPDVAADYPESPFAGTSGFSFWVPLATVPSSWSFAIEAICADGSAATLAEVTGHLTIEERQPGSGTRVVTAPDFVVIGTQRGGTTSLHAYLTAHPMVRAATTKELHFITDRFARGRDWYVGQFPSDLEPGMLTGEATPYALFHPCAPYRLRDVAPVAKLIVLLRNPVDRAYSHYLLERSRGDETLSFAEALDAEPHRLFGEEAKLIADPTYVSEPHKHASYASRGAYSAQLERWLTVFPREQMLILRSEDLYRRPAPTIARVTDFLCLPSAPGPDFDAHNRSAGPALNLTTRERLARHFAPLNAQLADFLGWDPDWEEPPRET
jgi:hypothetical protein